MNATASANPTASGKLTTHVLDTASGCPAEGMKIELFKLSGMDRVLVKSVVTNADGRVDGGPLLTGADLRKGIWELEFHAGDYFRSKAAVTPEILFLDVIPIRFGLSDEAAHYHVPLLVSPWSYSTYRGS